jgi:hypothetical protein
MVLFLSDNHLLAQSIKCNGKIKFAFHISKVGGMSNKFRLKYLHTLLKLYRVIAAFLI